MRKHLLFFNLLLHFIYEELFNKTCVGDKMKIAICDDDQKDLDLIFTYVMKYSKQSNIEIKCDLYSDGKDLLDNLNNELDAVFLDIDMPNPNGIEVANTINEKFPELNIVFVTNRTELVFDIIKFRPIGFVRKNEIENEIIDTITRVQNEVYSRSVIYHNTTKNSTIKIKLNDIIFLESRGHNIEIHTKDSVQKIRATMSEYENKLNSYGFVRIHKGFIVNMRYISLINGRKIKLDDGTELTVGGNYVDNMRGDYAKFISKKYCI